MKIAEMVFIPSPGIGHLVSTTEMARLLVNRDDRLSVTVLIMKLPFDDKFTNFTKSLTASTISDRIRFIDLPLNEAALDLNSKDIVNLFMETYKPYVKDAVSELIQSNKSRHDSRQLVGFFVDMFTTTMIDVANEFGVRSYVFFTSSAGFLSLMFYLQSLLDEQNIDSSEFKDSDIELVISSFKNPIPARVLPTPLLNKDSSLGFLNFARRYKETKGIVVNTFLELESHVINSICNNTILPLYPVGPVLNVKRDSNNVGSSGAHENVEVMEWLDRQPPLSVVFLCFGSMGGGSFSKDQVKEIAYALEHSGYRFLWSLRRSPAKGMIDFPGDYENHREILPDGFMDRMADIGMIIGWAPQVAILAHPAIGGFVSHCGWNSILESLWFGVPIATWPLDGEQQFNAFEIVIEMELAVEIKLDYRKELFSHNKVIVSAEEIEGSIRHLMKRDSDLRKKVKEMSEKSKKALMDGQSSYSALGQFIKDLMGKFP